MSIQAVIFDIGGVLEINPTTGWPERWARRLGMKPDRFERLMSAAGTPGAIATQGLSEIERRTALALSIDQHTVTELMDDMWTEYLGTLNRELVDYFSRLRPRYKTGMLSNSFVGAREREQEAHGFEDLCDVIVYSHEQGCQKPNPRIYRIICDRLNVAPNTAVLLDDVQENVDGAVAAGMRAVTYRSNDQAIADLNTLLGGRFQVCS
jgi:epoxide hydrolase-like predicted phosphatase